MSQDSLEPLEPHIENDESSNENDNDDGTDGNDDAGDGDGAENGLQLTSEASVSARTGARGLFDATCHGDHGTRALVQTIPRLTDTVHVAVHVQRGVRHVLPRHAPSGARVHARRLR